MLIVADNLGYGDIGCYGSNINRTPNLDRLAREGIKLTSFYVGSSICTPSRASFMTGCYPARVSMEISGTRRGVLQPVAQKGLAPSEITIAEILKGQGYATVCLGKWHLGDQRPFLPTRQGFDHYLGVPYSEDMIATTAPRVGEMWPPLPLLRDETVIEAPVDPNTLTKRYTDAALQFIRSHRTQPFFVYFPHAVPGSSREAFASEAFRERSTSGVYGACVEELDWSAGEILKCLQEEGLDKNTIVVWTSDNGAFQGNRAEPYGQNTPLRGTGGSAYEGGFRVPCLVRWPGRIPANVTSDELVTSMDLLPTLAKRCGTAPPKDRIIDGKDVWPVLSGDGKSPHDAFYYYAQTQLRAVRSGPWKLHLPVNLNATRPQTKPRFEKLQLYNIAMDPMESNEVSQDHPHVVFRLTSLADQARTKLGDVGRLGVEQRPAGWVDDVESLRLPGLPSTRGLTTDVIPLIAPGLAMTRWDSASLNGWGSTSSVALHVNDATKLFVSPIQGDAVIHNVANDPTGKQKDAFLTSVESYGDAQIHVEFLLTEGSNSGLYLMGRYEIQLRDSYGTANDALKYNDSGGLYQQWDDNREVKGYGGTAPSTNASRPAGQWQSLDITFHAPRFNDDGVKIENARLISVEYNGQTIHGNVQCPGITRGSSFAEEAPTGPLVFQGNHGPVALRNVWVKMPR